MKDLTITLDDETLEWLQVKAAEKGLSVSQLVSEMLASHREQENDYDAAHKNYLARGPFPLTGQPQQYPTRDALYDRKVLLR